MGAITPEYWIACHYGGEEVVMISQVPSTGLQPTTKQEAWEAAKANGWTGTYDRPRCPECSIGQ